jgi:hypothetical protein
MPGFAPPKPQPPQPQQPSPSPGDIVGGVAQKMGDGLSWLWNNDLGIDPLLKGLNAPSEGGLQGPIGDVGRTIFGTGHKPNRAPSDPLVQDFYQQNKRAQDPEFAKLPPDVQQQIATDWNKVEWDQLTGGTPADILMAINPQTYASLIPGEQEQVNYALYSLGEGKQLYGEYDKATPQQRQEAIAGGNQLLAFLGVGQMRGLMGADLKMSISPAQIEALAKSPAGTAVRNMAWRGMSAVSTAGGRVPHADAQIGAFLPNWPKIAEKMHQDFELSRSNARLRASNIPVDVSDQAVQDALQIPPAENVTLRTTGGKPEETMAAMERLPSGELQQRVSNLSKADRNALFKRMAVGNLDELMQKVSEGTLTSKQVQWLSKNWKKYFPTDLYRVDAVDQSLRSPHDHLDAMPEAQQPQGQKFLGATHNLIAETMTGPYLTDQAVIGSYLRSLFGLQRGTVKTHSDWLTTRNALLKDSTTGEARTKAMEGDQAAYDQLAPHEKMVVDAERWIYAVLRNGRRGLGKTDASTNYFPRRFIRDPAAPRAVGGASRPIASTVTQHREENLTTETPEQQAQRQTMLQEQRATIQAERANLPPDAPAKDRRALDRQLSHLDQQLRYVGPHLQLQQRFPTVGHANTALLEERSNYVRDHLAELERSGPLEPAARTAEQTRLEAEAKEAYPMMETNADKVVPGDLLRAIQSYHTDMAIRDLQGAMIEDRGVQLQVAYVGPQARETEQFLKNRAYVHLQGGAHAEVRWHPQAARLLDRYREVTSGGGSKGQRVARAIERQFIKNIMYSPMIHGLNIAGRLGWAMAAHPMLVSDEIAKSLGGMPATHAARAREAFNAGFLPQLPFKKAGAEFYEGYGVGTGDSEAASVPGLNDLKNAPNHIKGSATAKAIGLGEAVSHAYTGMNDAFWAKYNQFGVMMYHVEKRAAIDAGIPEVQARLWAADRANAWVGHVRPENWTRQLNDLSRHLLFAPNWWRTFGALMTGHYDRTGLVRTPGLRAFVVQNEIKTLMAAFAFQKVTGNALNYALSGHFQWENQPGNQDRLELDRFVPVDPKTGAHQTMENPMARQIYALEKGFGFEGSQTAAPGIKGWNLEQVPASMASVAASRLSPIVNALAAAVNIDTYQSATRGELYKINPADGAFTPGGPQLLAALGQITPLNLTHSIETIATQGPGPEEPLLPGWTGTTAPKNIKDALGLNAERLLLGMIGINPPYPYAPRAEGKRVTQDELQKVAQTKQHYDDNLQALSREVFDGTVPPNVAVQRYHDLTTAYHGFLNATFQGAPYYKNGQLGLLHDWEDLYRQATAPDGQLDWVKLDDLQQKFTQSHTTAEMQAMHGAISNAEVKVPFLQIYHKTIDQYRSFQQSAASQVGVPLSTLRQQTNEYAALYGNQAASGRYLFSHPQLAEYERLKKTWETQSTAGLMYGMFYSTATVMRWLQARGLNSQQLLQRLAGQMGVQNAA